MNAPTYNTGYGAAGAPPSGQLTPSMLQQLAQQYAGPLAAPAIQRSKYLAQALEQMSHQGENIRTTGALTSNLLAEALLQWGRARSDRELQSDINSGRTSLLNSSALPGEVTAPTPANPQAGGGILANLASGFGHLFHGDQAAQAGASPMQAAPSGPPAAAAPPPPPMDTSGTSGPPVAPGVASLVAAMDARDAATGGPGAGTAPPPPQGAPNASAPAGVDVPAPGSERDLLARAMVWEAGDSPKDMLAAATVIHNRANMAGDSQLDELYKPHQFEAVNNRHTWAKLQALPQTSPAYQQGLQAVDQVATQGPVGNWDHFYSPGAQSALGRAKPAWDDGTGQAQGKQLYFAQGYGGKPALQQAPSPGGSAFAQSGPPGSNQGGGSPMPGPTAQPVALTDSVVTPMPAPHPQSPPSAFATPGGGGQPTAPVTNGAPSQGFQQASYAPPSAQQQGGQGQAQTGDPMGGGGSNGFAPQPVPFQPWQIERLNKLKQAAIGDVRFTPAFEAYKAELTKQATTPEELEQTRPNDAGQVEFYGKSTGRLYGVQSPGGMIIAAGPKMTSNGQGGFSPVAGTGEQVLSQSQANALGYHGNSVVTQNQATGGTSVAQQPDFAPSDYLTQRSGFISGDTYQTASKTVRAVNAVQKILAGATNNNGAADTGALDNLVQAETGLSAKVGTMKLFLENFDLPASVQNQILHLTGPGSITPNNLAEALNVLRSYGAAHSQAAQRELAGLNAAIGSVSGGRYKDLGVEVPSMDPLPNVPWMGAANPVAAGSPAQGPAPANAPPPRSTAQGAPVRLDPRDPDAAFAQLQPGSLYVGPDGHTRRK